MSLRIIIPVPAVLVFVLVPFILLWWLACWTIRLIIRLLRATVMLALTIRLILPAQAQPILPAGVAARLASQHAPMVEPSTLLAFAYHESRLHPFAIHDNSTGQSVFPATAAEASSLARVGLARGHSLDLGIMQVNSANLARTGLTVTTAFDAGESMRAGAMILTAAYRQCQRLSTNPSSAEQQQIALRCAASVYNTGREQAGILNGYQASVWRAAAVIVPAIQLSGLPSPPMSDTADVVAPEPRRPPPALEDALHATPPVPDSNDGLSDALQHTIRKEIP